MGIYPTQPRTAPRTVGEISGRLWARIVNQRTALVALECAILIGLLALLYLSQIGAVTSANASLQRAQMQQTTLGRQNAQAHAQLAATRNPAWIDRQARALGLAPVTTDTLPRPIVIPINIRSLAGQSGQGAR
ncbi:MAG: hypothetical protein ABI068_17230 [Ktedonobacterales bacterium]